MATDETASRLHEHSLIGVSVSLAAAVIFGVVAAALNAPDSVQTAVVATAAGLPSVVGYRLAGKRRDKGEDLARLRHGQLDRPVVLVGVILAAAIFVAVSIGAFIASVAAHLFALTTGPATTRGLFVMFA